MIDLNQLLIFLSVKFCLFFFFLLNLGDFFLGSFKHSSMCIKTNASINL